MSDRSDKPQDSPPERDAARGADREARLAKALRDNLRRRKSADRARHGETSES